MVRGSRTHRECFDNASIRATPRRVPSSKPQLMDVSMLNRALILFLVACNSSVPADSDTAEPSELLAGTYDVDGVTCDGDEVSVTVTATVTFDESSYVEHWTFPEAECEVTLDGSVDATDTELTLEDVMVTCADACETDGFCDPTPCPIDQVYTYTIDGDTLLLSFTQRGSEHACGPCGDGVPTTYSLVSSSAQ